MTEKQAHTILYTFWELGYLDKNFTEPHTEYDWAVNLLMNPPGVYCKIWNDYSVKKINSIYTSKAKEIQSNLYEGCYLLYSNAKLVYVGVSKCIYSRLKQHKRENIKQWDTVKFIEEHDREKALEIEYYLIQKFKPIYNKSGTSLLTKK